MSFKSNGKILLSGEYLVLEGAKAIALPSKLTQELKVENIKGNYIIWQSIDYYGNLWFEEKFYLKNDKLVCNGEKNIISEKIISLFNHIHIYNDIKNSLGKKFITKLNFKREWGLGSSSTFVNNLAKWANLDPYKLLFSTFDGSGYDIACCDSFSPIIYTRKGKSAEINEISFNPPFIDKLYFVYLGNKQNTHQSVKDYYSKSFDKEKFIEKIDSISEKIMKSKDLNEFENLLEIHESTISEIISIEPVQKNKFSDYNGGKIKSLGSWGGDFVLVTSKSNNLNYFKDKGYNTIFPVSELVYIN